MWRPKARAGVWLATGGLHQQRAAAVHSNSFTMAPSVTTRLRLPTPPQLREKNERPCPRPGTNAAFVARAPITDEFPDEFPDSLCHKRRCAVLPRANARRSVLPENPHLWRLCARAARARTAKMRRPKAHSWHRRWGAPAACRSCARQQLPPSSGSSSWGPEPPCGDRGREAPLLSRGTPCGRSQITLWTCR